MTAPAAALCVLAAAAAGAERIELRILADATVHAHPAERGAPGGAGTRLKLKGIEDLILLDADWSRLRGKAVRSAVLRLAPDGPVMVRWIGVSTVASAWEERTATFLAPARGRRWDGPCPDILGAVFGRAGTAWSRTEARRALDGRIEVPIEPRLIEACAAGASHGLALSDDSGQTMHVPRALDPDSNLSNHFFRSRESGRDGPVLVVETGLGTPAPFLPPEPAALPEPRDLPPPLRIARPEHRVARGGVRVFAAPDGVRIDPRDGTVFGGSPFPARSVALHALRGEWVAFQVALPGPAAWTLEPGPLRGPNGAAIPATAVWLHRVVHVRTASGGWIGDPLCPLRPGEPVAVPADPAAFPGQRLQPVYAELFVPRDASAGWYAGPLGLRRDGGKPERLDLRLRVLDAELPAETSFVFSMNAYSTPGGAAERALYALMHDHRTTLAILHYSHSGRYAPGCVPPVEGRGAAACVADWSAWDDRFGPLFDGTAFAATTRPGIPLDHFYLALSEHYPTPMTAYRWNDLPWERHWREAGPIEAGFDADYRSAWTAVARDYLEHVKAKGWRTAFHVYLNDKYFFKMMDPGTGRRGDGVSFWLFDEPQHADDFLALRFFGRLLREAQGGDRSRLRFRVDVSRPEWGRDLLDDVVDVNVTGGFPRYADLLHRWKIRHGQTLWTYGDSPGLDEPPCALSFRALDLWSRGVDGFVPWLVLGEPDGWRTFATTAVVLPDPEQGWDAPRPTLRLKAYRRAEQDVTLAAAFARRRRLLNGDPLRRRAAALLRDAFPPSAEAALDGEGARFGTFPAATAERLEALRAALREEGPPQANPR